MIDSSLKNANILIINDPEENIAELQGFLEIQGYTNTKRVSNSSEVANTYAFFFPDLILLDLGLPDKWGFKVIDQIKKLSPENFYLPILLLTANDTGEVKKQVLSAGVNDYLTKPFDLVELGLRIRNLLYTKYLYQLMQDQNLNLENKVNERTLELEKKNLELNAIKEKVEESELQIRQLANNLIDGMIYQVVAIDETRRKFTYVSNTVKKFYGCTPEEVMNNADLIYSRIYEGDIKRLMDEELVALNTMTPVKTELRMIKPNGEIRWSYFASTPRFYKGITYWDGIEIDITDRKKNEQELIKAKEKAEESDRLKTSFINNISHEFRVPLNSILGFSSLLHQQDIQPKDEKMYLEIIKQSSNRLINTVTNFMDISMLHSGNVSTNIDKINCRALVNAVLTEYNEKFIRKNLSVSIEFSDDKNLDEFYSDHELMRKIFTQLIDNAVKFNKPNGAIDITMKIADDNLLFSLKDTGIGISEENKEKVFVDFMQEYPASNSGYEGSGLGLTIAKGFVDLLGGKIWLETRKFNGTTFYITIPNQSSWVNENLNKQIKIVQPGIEKQTILVVEDDEINYKFIEILLSTDFIELLHAKNGIEAIEYCEKHPEIKIVLMDIRLPGIDGLEATKRIKSFRDNLPIFALTAYVGFDYEQKVKEAGCDGFIGKPIKKEILLSKLSDYGIYVESDDL
jgi:PAS domain S-box-containing protein